jgi:hypothetical protein
MPEGGGKSASVGVMLLLDVIMLCHTWLDFKFLIDVSLYFFPLCPTQNSWGAHSILHTFCICGTAYLDPSYLCSITLQSENV